MAKERAPHMPFYGREFYGDINVMAQDLEEQGAYIRLLWICWQEGAIPADVATLAAVCNNTPVSRFEKKIWPKLRELFEARADGRLIHHKVESLRADKEKRRMAWSEAGKRGNEKRWGNGSGGDQIAIDSRSGCDGLASGNGSGIDRKIISADYRIPNTDYQDKNICASGDARLTGSPSVASINEPPFATTEPEVLFPVEAKPASKPIGGLTPQQETWFNEWWPAYWLHKAKKAAMQAFGRQVRTAETFKRVMEATAAQSPEMMARESSHRPHASTWLNGERWTDELTPAGSVRRGGVSDAIDQAMQLMDSKGD